MAYLESKRSRALALAGIATLIMIALMALVIFKYKLFRKDGSERTCPLKKKNEETTQPQPVLTTQQQLTQPIQTQPIQTQQTQVSQSLTREQTVEEPGAAVEEGVVGYAHDGAASNASVVA